MTSNQCCKRPNASRYLALIFSLLLFAFLSFVNVEERNLRICSWNIRDFGQSKNETEIEFIANTLRYFDIVLIQEVVAGKGGAQAVTRLADALNRKGTKWEYVVSNPTFGQSYKKERYAFLWKPSKVKKVGEAWLEQRYKVEIDREPFIATFSKNGKEFTLINFHAITKSKQPEREIKYLKLLPGEYRKLNLIFCGDFNLPESHSVFNPLKSMGYIPVFRKQKTTLRKTCQNDDCLSAEYDNFFFKKSTLSVLSSGVVHFYKEFNSLEEAYKISDHLPIYFQFSLN